MRLRAVDARRAPARIIRLHSPDKRANLWVDRRPTEWPRAPAPKKPESGAVSRDNRLGFHDDQGTGPAAPRAPEGDPEKSVDVAEWRSGLFPLENDELLTEGGRLQPEPVSRNDERAQVHDCADDKTDHDRHAKR